MLKFEVCWTRLYLIGVAAYLSEKLPEASLWRKSSSGGVWDSIEDLSYSLFWCMGAWDMVREVEEVSSEADVEGKPPETPSVYSTQTERALTVLLDEHLDHGIVLHLIQGDSAGGMPFLESVLPAHFPLQLERLVVWWRLLLVMNGSAGILVLGFFIRITSIQVVLKSRHFYHNPLTTVLPLELQKDSAWISLC